MTHEDEEVLMVIGDPRCETCGGWHGITIPDATVRRIHTMYAGARESNLRGSDFQPNQIIVGSRRVGR